MPNPIVYRRIISPMFRRDGGVNPYLSQYLTRLDAEGGSITGAEQGYLNTFLNSIQTDEFDRLWVHGLSNQIAARISLVNAATADLITEVNAPTFTAGQGYAGNGTTQYLNTNYNPSVDGVKYTLNSASIGSYVLYNVDAVSYSIGGQDVSNKSRIIPRAANLIYAGINESTGISISTALNADSRGLITSLRNNATEINAYKNGASILNALVASNGIPNLDLYILGLNISGALSGAYANTISFSFVGSGAINQAAFYTEVQALGTSIGWAV